MAHQGGDDAEFATLMADIKGAEREKTDQYPILAMTDLTLDPKPLATGAYGQVRVHMCMHVCVRIYAT